MKTITEIIANKKREAKANIKAEYVSIISDLMDEKSDEYIVKMFRKILVAYKGDISQIQQEDNYNE